MNCRCPQAGFCPRYQRWMQGRLYELCSGVCPTAPCPPDLRAQYQALWLAGLKPPSLLRRLSNFIAAFFQHSQTTKPHVSTRIYERRMAICRRCPAQLYQVDRLGNEICRHTGCGCLLSVKARWREQHCPVDYW